MALDGDGKRRNTASAKKETKTIQQQQQHEWRDKTNININYWLIKLIDLLTQPTTLHTRTHTYRDMFEISITIRWKTNKQTLQFANACNFSTRHFKCNFNKMAAFKRTPTHRRTESNTHIHTHRSAHTDTPIHNCTLHAFALR